MDNKNNPLDRSEIEAILADFNKRKNAAEDELAPPEPSIDAAQENSGESEPKSEKAAGKINGALKPVLARLRTPRRKADKESEASDHRNRRAKAKAFFRSLPFKITACVLAAAVLVVIAVFAVRAVQAKKIADTQAEYGVQIAEGMQLDYIEEYAANQDFVGHLSIDGSDVDYNVYQGDDNDYYATRGENARNSDDGCVYMDWRDTTEPQSRSIVLYASDAYFGSLESMYASPEACAKNPVITFDTLYRDGDYKVIGAFYTNTDKAADSGKMFPYAAANLTDESFIDFRTNLSTRLLYTTGREILRSDKILMLSAPSDLFDSARFVVVAVQMTGSDSKTLNAGDCIINENVHYPQAYYDKTGEENPYATATQWYPVVQTGGEDTSRLNDKDLDAYLD